MPRLCGPCGSPLRNKIDERLLKMEITQESYRKISQEFGFSEFALRRHKEHHLTVDLSDVHQAMEEARKKALAEVHAKELEETKNEVKEGIAARLETAANYFDQLLELRNKAASLLDQAEGAGDLKSAGTFLKELREQIRLMGELEGKLSQQPQINFILSPEWVELRTKVLVALDPFPEAKEAIVHAIHEPG